MESKEDDWWNLDDHSNDDYDILFGNDYFCKRRHVEIIDDSDDDDIFASLTDQVNRVVPIAAPKLPGRMFHLDEFESYEKATFSDKNGICSSYNNDPKSDQMSLVQLTNEITANMLIMKAAFNCISSDAEESNEITKGSALTVGAPCEVTGAPPSVSEQINDLINKQSEWGDLDLPITPTLHHSLLDETERMDKESTHVSETFYRMKSLQSELDERVLRLQDGISIETILPIDIPVGIAKESGDAIDCLTLNSATRSIVSSLAVTLDMLHAALPGTVEESRELFETNTHCLPTVAQNSSEPILRSASNNFTARLDAIEHALGVTSQDDDMLPFPKLSIQFQPFNTPMLLTNTPNSASNSLLPMKVVRSSSYKNALRQRNSFKAGSVLESRSQLIDSKGRLRTEPISSTEWRDSPVLLSQVECESTPVMTTKEATKSLDSSGNCGTHDLATSHTPFVTKKVASSKHGNYTSEMADIISKENYLQQIQALKQSLIMSM